MRKIIITIGPSLFGNTSLKEIDSQDYIYRINGAQGSIREIENYINKIRSELPSAEILIDLPGNKLRAINLDRPIQLEIDKKFKLLADQINYRDFYKYLKAGDIVFAKDSTLKFVIEDINEKGIIFTSKSEGRLLSNNGFHVRGIYENIPFLFQKDKELAELANKYKVSFVGLSFVRTADDINLAKEIIDDDITVISKIETKLAVDNLDDILKKVDHVLIDRGDLSSDIGLEKVPAYQKSIIEKANSYGKKVFLATQFLKNMEEKPVPTIAEVVDMYNTFKTGVYGIQLSEETAIGKYPKECLEVIKKIIKEIDLETK